MKHLRLFKTESEYNSATLELPNVSFVEEINVVNYNPGSSSSSDYVMVDFGLPSGLLWADRNIGAASPEDAGLYFAWGDTKGYTVEQVENGEYTFGDWSSYYDTSDNGQTFNKYGAYIYTEEDEYGDTYPYVDCHSNVYLKSEDDAATVHMGEGWRIPSMNDFFELFSNSTAVYVDKYGGEWDYEITLVEPEEWEETGMTWRDIVGMRLTSKINGKTLFIPLVTVLGDRGGWDVQLWANKIFTKFEGYEQGAYYGKIENRLAERMCCSNSDSLHNSYYDYIYGDLKIDDAKYNDFVTFRHYGIPVRGVKSK